jgi:hypothetical protein
VGRRRDFIRGTALLAGISPDPLRASLLQRLLRRNEDPLRPAQFRKSLDIGSPPFNLVDDKAILRRFVLSGKHFLLQ